MRFLVSIVLPVAALAQSYPMGNPAGLILGIFGMCGTDPVDCGNGWCCQTGQPCTDGPKGANTMCYDNTMTDENGYIYPHLKDFKD